MQAPQVQHSACYIDDSQELFIEIVNTSANVCSPNS